MDIIWILSLSVLMALMAIVSALWRIRSRAERRWLTALDVFADREITQQRRVKRC
jgi:hypothetical protein